MHPISLSHDFRLALREIRRQPVFSITVALILGLALGANIAIFNFINLLSWKPIPARNPEELVGVWTGDLNPALDGYGWTSFPDFEHYRDHARVFSGLAAWMVNLASLSSADGHAEWTEAWSVTGEYFQVLGVDTVLGRPLGPQDDVPDAPRVAVLSHALWRSRFDSDTGVVGRHLQLNGHPFSIIGVAPRDFSGNWAARQADLWVPKRNVDVLRSPEIDWRYGSGIRWLGVLGRLRPGVTVERAEEALQPLGKELQRLYPDEKRTRKPRVVPARMVPPSEKHRFLPTARIMAWAVAFLLVIACANTSVLLLVRGVGQRRELATRLAVGATRWRVVRQGLISNLALSSLGCLVGLGFGILGSRLIAHFIEAYAHDLKFDTHVLLFAVGITAAAPVLFGLLPALLVSRPDLVSSLKEGRSSRGTSAWTSRLFTGLAVVQVALALVLALGAGLLQRSVLRLSQVDLGFDPTGVLVAQLNLAQQGYSPAEGRRAYQQLLDRLETSPQIQTASLVRFAPLQGITRAYDVALPESPEQEVAINYNVVGPRYLTAVGIPVVAGRDLERWDDEDAPGAIVVSQSAADTLWPGEPAVGRSVLIEGQEREGFGSRFEVVGVAADSLYEDFTEDRPEPLIYLSFHQSYQATLKLLLRFSGSPPANASVGVRDELAIIDPYLALGEVSTLEQHVRSSLWQERMYAQIAGVFALLGLVVAVWGVFSMLSYAVSQRSHELGLRIVLGARRADLLRLVFGQGALILALGLLLGLAFSFWGTRWIQSFLFGVGAHDPWTFALVCVAFTAVALVACYLPARRAARLQPLESIRWE